METPNSATKVWLLATAATLGMIVFAGLYFSTPKAATPVQTAPNFVTNTVVSIVTNEIVKEVPKEVEKIVKVPAEIPQEYIQAAQVVSNFDNADFVKQDQVLFGMKDVKIEYALGDDVKRVVSEDEVKSKFELTLRRNNIPVNPKSINTVWVTVDGFFGDSPATQLVLTHIPVGWFNDYPGYEIACTEFDDHDRVRRFGLTTEYLGTSSHDLQYDAKDWIANRDKKQPAN